MVRVGGSGFKFATGYRPGVQICCDNGAKLELEALTFPVIFSKFLFKVDVTKCPHIQSVNLAHDFGEGHDQIDILIGSDHYWDIVTGKTESDFRPTDVNRKLVFLKTGTFEKMGQLSKARRPTGDRTTVHLNRI